MHNPSTSPRTPVPSRGRVARALRAVTRRIAAPLLGVSVFALMGLNACLSESELGPGDFAVENSIRAADSIRVADSLKALPLIFAITSFEKTGSYSVRGLDSAYSKNTLDPVHSDAAVRYLGGDDIFVINKMGRDNLQLVDRRHLKTVLQIPLPALSNPHDVAIKDGLIYVAYYALAKIGVFRQSDGAQAGEIDLSPYADTVDHLPETTALRFIDGDLFALLQNLDMAVTYKPQTSRLLRIDVGAKTVKKSLDLPFGNPMGMAWDATGRRLYVSCLGEYSHSDWSVKTDGGIVAIDPAAMAVIDTVALEKDLGGNVNGPIFHKGGLILTVGTGMSDNIISLSIADGKVSEIVKLGGYATGGLAMDAPTSTLFVGDRKKGGPGLRLFDLATWKEKSAPGIDIGALPPSDLAIVR